MDLLSTVLPIVSGLILLFTGRKLFWLAAALAVFLFAYPLLQNIFGSGVYGMLAAALIGLVFVWLAIRFIKAIGVIIGALAGAVGLPVLLGILGIQGTWWILALIGAIVGVLVVSLAFESGLILMTSWMGANVIAGAVRPILPSSAIAGLVFIVLLIAGITIQATQLGKR